VLSVCTCVPAGSGTPFPSWPIRNPARRGRAVKSRPAFDRERHKQHNVVERCFNRLKQWRGIATRYDKTAQSYQAAVTLAALMIWIRTD
jgi:transposase